MTVRRVVQLLICVLATFAVALAQPKKQPAPDPAPTPDQGTGTAAPPPDEGPPPDMEGKDENPNAPRLGGDVEVKVEDKVPEKKPKTGYPIEEAQRPIILPQGMAEVAIGPRAQVDIDGVGYAGSDTLRARYSIVRQFQIGLNYALGGVYDDPKTMSTDKVGLHPGKTLGLEGTYLIRDFVGVRLGVPVFIYKPAESAPGGSAPAIGLTIGVPLKFRFGEKFALGGMDDLLAIRLSRFAPSFDYEYQNAYLAAANDVGSSMPDGQLRFSGYGIYQQSPKLALIGRVAVTLEDFSAEKTNAGRGAITSMRAGIEYTVKTYLDVGFSIGFEDLSDLGSFGPGTLLAFRI